MSERPQGLTGERCKENGTYCSQAGATQYYELGEPFGPCPVQGRPTRWERVT